MMQIVDETCGPDGVDATCAALGVCRASYYRSRQPRPYGPRYQMRCPRALLPEEQRTVLDLFHEDRFADLAPAQVYATLLDEGRYVCSERTMYRLLTANHELRERRAQLMHPRYEAPELLATSPNQLWSWDITKLKGPTTWSYFYLYVIIDVFSRCVVGWMLAPKESATLAEKLIEETCERHGIAPGQLTIHADRGSSMRSKLVAQLLADLGVTQTHSRPHVSNDNPFSEALFRTLKYRPEFPAAPFESIDAARAWVARFVHWYNEINFHSGIGHVTPSSRHQGRDAAILAKRRTVYAAARRRNPGRWSGDVRDCTHAGPVSLNPQRPAVVATTTNEAAA